MPAKFEIMTVAEVDAECRRCQGQSEVSGRCARSIAHYWHGGQSSAMYAFASTGHYDRAALLDETRTCITRDNARRYTCADKLQMDMFGTYCINRAG